MEGGRYEAMRQQLLSNHLQQLDRRTNVGLIEKEQLIFERDGMLLKLQEAEAKNAALLNHIKEQSALMQNISQNFKLKLSQAKEVNQKLLSDMRIQKANYANRIQELMQKPVECEVIKAQLIADRIKMQETKSENQTLKNRLNMQTVLYNRLTNDYKLKISKCKLKLHTDTSNQKKNISKLTDRLKKKHQELLDSQLAAQTKYANLQKLLQLQTATLDKNAASIQKQSDENEKLKNQIKLLEHANVYLKHELKNEQKNKSCPICLCPWEDSGSHRLVSLQCGHLFGANCVRDHLNRNPTCPICRSSAKKSSPIYIFGTNVIPMSGLKDKHV